MDAHQSFPSFHLLAPWGLAVSWASQAPGFPVCVSFLFPTSRLCSQWAAQLWAFSAWTAWPYIHHGCFCYVLETTDGRRKQFLQCFWPLVPPAPQIFNHQTFLWEWVFPVNSIPAETGPINTSAFCRRVYLAGKWVLPCKQEAPWSYYLQMRLKSHMFIFMGFENSEKAREEVGEALIHSQWEQGLQSVTRLCFIPSGNGWFTVTTQPRATAEIEVLVTELSKWPYLDYQVNRRQSSPLASLAQLFENHFRAQS